MPRRSAIATLATLGAATLLLPSCGETAAPASHFVLLDGSTREMSSFLGQAVLLNFWATSCTSCVAEMPQLAATHQKFHARGLHTLAVAMSYDKPEYVLNFATSRRLPFLIAIDSSGAVAREWGGVRLTPTTFLVSTTGHIARRYVGPPDFAQLHQHIEQVLTA